MQQVATPTRTFVAGGAIPRFARVKLVAGELAVAVLDDYDIGTIQDAAFAAGEERAVRLRTAQGTEQAIAAKAITAGSVVYTAAAGKVSDTNAAGSFRRGLALTAASGDGSVIEILPFEGEVPVPP